MGFGATILRPAYFIDNVATVKDAIAGYGVYPMPVGAKGLAMVDTADIAEGARKPARPRAGAAVGAQ